MDQIQDCYDKIMLITLHKMYGVKAELVGDDKISIDGQVMDEQQFTDWLYDKEVELGHIQEPEREYDA